CRFWSCGCGHRRRLGGNAPEDHGSGVLNGFQALAQETGVSMPDLNVVSGGGSVFESDGLADDESHGFGLGLADGLGGEGAAFSPVQHLMADLMYQRREFLGR